MRLIGLLALTGGIALSAEHASAVSYEVGFISGTVLTSAGAPVPSVRVTARSLSSSGSVTSWADSAGQYTLEVPTGDYAVEAQYESVSLGRLVVSVDVQEMELASFAFRGATLHGEVRADDGPSSYSRIHMQEVGPAGCAAADSCEWIEPGDPEGSCVGCLVGERQYDCWGGQCSWWDTASFSATTNQDGDFSKLVRQGTFEIRAYSGNIPGQSGEVLVGTTVATVSDGVDGSADVLAYATAFVEGTVTRNGEPLSNARIDASPTGGGTIRDYTDGAGAYRLRVPLGDYQLRAWTAEGDQIGTESLRVEAAQSTQTLDFAYASPDGQLQGAVTRDGTGAPHAYLFVNERGPASCEVADACGWIEPADPTGTCYGCAADGRSFDCWGGQCFWWEPQRYTVHADANGWFDHTVVAGAYDVTVRSASEPGQYGDVQVASLIADVPAGGAESLGTIEYRTGLVSGTITSCGVPSLDTMVEATTQGGTIRAWVTSTSGEYQLRLPAGDYSARVRWENAVLSSQPLTVDGGGSYQLSHDADNGQLRGTILRDGLPAVGARAHIRERGPASCEVADACDWIEPGDPTGSCYGCNDDGRGFDCSESQCFWWDAGNFNAYTGADGTFLRDVPAGHYDVDAYSANVPGQSGQILVGTVEAVVNCCELSEIGASGTIVDASDSGAPIVLDQGVQLTFDDITGGGSVSFVSTSTAQGNPDPDIRFLGQYYDFVVEATFDGVVEVCLPYDPAEINNLQQLKMFHDVGGQWVQIDVMIDDAAHMACGLTDSFSWYVLGEVLNSPPVADAGAPIEVSADADCMGAVSLDARGSSDPDGGSDIVAYSWDLEGAEIGDGPSPAVALPLGEHVVRLTVLDTAGEAHTDTVRVTVVDTTKPTFDVTVTPEVLWPPNGKLHTIEPTWTVSDNCDDAPTVVLDQVSSSTAPEGDIVLDDGILLRARREGDELDGRMYVIEYSAFDDAGNTTSASATVLVPHDQGAQ